MFKVVEILPAVLVSCSLSQSKIKSVQAVMDGLLPLTDHQCKSFFLTADLEYNLIN